MRVYSRSELSWLLNYSGLKMVLHHYFDHRANQYRVVNGRISRRKRPLRARILETISRAVPHFQDHHLVVAEKAIPFPELSELRPRPTSSMQEWIQLRSWPGISDPRLS
jgi:hypothetical protein